MHLWLARHGITQWNALQRLQGQSDIPLSEAGRRQARLLAERLADTALDAIFTSDLQRANRTAQEIARFRKVPVIVDRRWREIAFGEWEGQDYEEIKRRDPETLSRWEANMTRVAPPGGETLYQLARRTRQAYRDVQAEFSVGSVLIVAHGGPLQALACSLLKIPARRFWQFHLDPASLSQVSIYPAGAVITRGMRLGF